MLYAIQSTSGPVKIGHAKNVERRLAGLQNGNHDTLTLIWTAETDRELEIETELGRHYQAQRIRGEWYEAVILDDLQDTYDWCADNVVSHLRVPRNVQERGRWSRQALLDRGHDWTSTHGRAPRSIDWHLTRGGEWPSYQTCIREFGSWSLFLAAL